MAKVPAPVNSREADEAMAIPDAFRLALLPAPNMCSCNVPDKTCIAPLSLMPPLTAQSVATLPEPGDTLIVPSFFI
jgi:hypothetical protein